MDRKARYIASGIAAAVIAGAVLSSGLILLERAQVTMYVQGQQVEAESTLTGGPANQAFRTQLLTARLTRSQQGTASVVSTPATSATGVVRFFYSCQQLPCMQPREVPRGFIVATDAGVRYLTQKTFALVAPTVWVDAVVQAEQPGAAGNTGPNTIHWTPDNTLFLNTELKVTNPSAISGGADARTVAQIQSSDWTAVSTALKTSIATELGAQLKAEAGGLYVAQTSAPTFNVSSDASIGEYRSTFTVTVTGTVTAVAFDETQAHGQLRANLQANVPTGFALTQESIQTSYAVTQVSANGDVTLRGSASGIAAPTVSEAAVREQIRGMSVGAARSRITHMVPACTADIVVSPSAMPFLPIRADHIVIKIVVVSPGTPSTTD